jgi:hypothetical protein
LLYRGAARDCGRRIRRTVSIFLRSFINNAKERPETTVSACLRDSTNSREINARDENIRNVKDEVIEYS